MAALTLEERIAKLQEKQGIPRFPVRGDRAGEQP